jgi:hypothetical protein
MNTNAKTTKRELVLNARIYGEPVDLETLARYLMRASGYTLKEGK